MSRIEQDERTLPEGSEYSQTPFMEQTEPREKKVKEVQLMRWKISTFTREPLEHGKILQDLKVKSDSDLPGVSVGQDNLGALHMLFVHSPYRQLLSTEQLAPTAPVLLSAALPVAL